MHRHDAGAGNVQAQLSGAGVYSVFVTQQHHIGHVAAQHGVSGAQHTVVFRLGQHNGAAVVAGALDQFALEHQRGDHLGAGHIQGVHNALNVSFLLESGDGDVDLVLGTLGDVSLNGTSRQTHLEGVQGGGDDGQRGA